MRIPLIDQDKANHVAYGALIAAVALVAQQLLGLPELRSALIALAVVAAVGAIKELLDRRDPAHTADVMDFVATLAGGVLVVAQPLLSQLHALPT